MASPQPLQFPFAVAGRGARGGGERLRVVESGVAEGIGDLLLGSRCGGCDRLGFFAGIGERRPLIIDGSMGDSGDASSGPNLGIASNGSGRNALCLGGEICLSGSRGCRSAIEACRSAINESTWLVSDGLRRDELEPDRGGLDLELDLLCWLYPEVLDDCDALGVW